MASTQEPTRGVTPPPESSSARRFAWLSGLLLFCAVLGGVGQIQRVGDDSSVDLDILDYFGLFNDGGGAFLIAAVVAAAASALIARR